jgi:hypothetical protein
MGTRISALPTAGAFTGAELVPVVQSGNTVKATSSQFKTTNASDLTSGTISAARLPAATNLTQGAVALGNSTGSACEGNDARLSDSRTPSGAAGGDFVGTYPNPTLASTGATAGTYGSNSFVPQIQVDTKGRIVSVFSVPISGSAGGTVTSVDVSGGTTGLTASGGPITSSGSITLSGTLAVANGGTGAVNAASARTNLSAAKSGANTDITSISLSSGTVSIAPSAGTDIVNKTYADSLLASNLVTSFSAGSTGLTPNTDTTGVITLAGTLNVANGGTGQTTRQAAINALAGAQTSGQYLRGNGTNISMSAIQAGDVPTLNQNTTGTANNVTGTVATANGGTGLTATPANGQIPIGNGTGYTLSTLTAGTGVTISNSSGAVTINASTAAGITTAKAWVNFNGATAGTWAGGASTVTRVSGSTTATVTTTSNHNLITGNGIYALTGVVAGIYIVTVVNATTFTIQTVATTTLSAVSITFQISAIRASYNISSVTKNAVGDFTVNFATALADANYSATISMQDISVSTQQYSIIGATASGAAYQYTAAGLRIGNNYDSGIVCVQVFGN